MDYQIIYNAIIKNAKNNNRIKLKKNELNYIFYEKHHIIPKCMTGSNDQNNLVLLTPKEHYLCHKLLTYIYPTNKKIACAFYRMTFDKKGNIKISARNYAYAKIQYHSIPISEETRQKLKNRKVSEKTKEKMRKPKTKEHKESLKNAWKTRKIEKPTTQETKDKIINFRLGKHHSDKTILKLRDANIGENNPRFGKYHTEKTKEKMRKPRLHKEKFKIQYACIHCGRKMNKSNLTRYHNENCKTLFFEATP